MEQFVAALTHWPNKISQHKMQTDNDLFDMFDVESHANRDS